MAQRPIRLLQAAGSLDGWGGIERYIVNLEEGVSPQGFQCAVCTPEGSPLWTKGSGARFDVRTPPHNRLGAMPAYMKAMRAFQPDVVHVHYSPDYAAAAFAAKLCGVKLLVMTRHLVLPWAWPKAASLGTLYNRVIGVSDAVKRQLEHSGVPKNRLAVVKFGVAALEPSDPNPLANLLSPNSNRFPIVFVGRLIHEKGGATLIRALKDVPEADLHFFGSGPDEERLRSLNSELGLEGRCFFHGSLPDVANAMALGQILVVPSEWEEAFPNVVLEGMSLGLPVVVSRSGGMPEMIEDGVSGLIFEKGNVAELTGCLRRLIADHELRSRLGSAGRARYLAEFTTAHMGERFRSFYEKCLS